MTLSLPLFVVLTSISSLSGEETFPVAALNMDRIFKTYKPLLEQLAPLKESAKELEKTVELRTIELETIGSQLRKAQPGSTEFQRLQQQFAKVQNDLQQFIAQERGNLQKKEAAAYLAVYKRLEEEVGKYAKAKGIKLVIRQQDASLEENQPLPEILKSLNRGIIYDEGLDITDDILKAMEEASKPAEEKAAK